jgi:NAD(P)H-dependent FMN reductase
MRMSSTPVLLVVIGSTRPGRIGGHVGAWFAERARAIGGVDVRIADLAEIALPFLDEPAHPRLQRYEHAHTRAWSEVVASADAFAFVTPEYNHGYPAPLKNALDALAVEWRAKPAGIVSYGGVSAGLRAAAQLKQVLSALQMIPTPAGVPIPLVGQKIKDGALHATEVMNESADALVRELLRYQAATATLRS